MRLHHRTNEPIPRPWSASGRHRNRAALRDPAGYRRFPFAEILVATLAWLLQGHVGAETVDLVVLHTADLHGRVANLIPRPGADPDDGGWLRIATLIRATRAESPRTILVDAGDTIQGSPESHATRGREMLAALERMGYDAWIPGNHEFDWGTDHLQDLVRETRLPVLAANLGVEPDRENPFPRIRPYSLLTLDGVRIAIVGLTTPGIPRWFVPALLGPVRITDNVSTLRDLMPVLRAEQPDVRILVLHQGYRGGFSDHANRVAEALRRFPEFDVVIGGHSHEFVPGILVNGVLYAQSGYHGAALGRVDLTFDRTTRRIIRKQGRLLPAGRDIPEDPAEAEAWADRLTETRARLAVPVGRLAAPLDPRGEQPGHSGIERLLRAAITEAVDADIVLHGVLCGESLNSGEVTERDLWRIIPYENRIGVAHLTFREIREILEENLAQPRSPRFMGISGALVTIDPAAPVGKRVVRMRLPDGSSAHGRKRFRVAFNSYTLGSAGGRYFRLRELALQPRSQFVLTDRDTRDAVRRFLADHPDLDLSGPPQDGYRME